MAEWNAQDVIAIAPEFATIDPATLSLWIAYAESMVNAEAFGSRYKLAGILMSAHLLTVLPPTGAGAPEAVGPIQSESVGGVSVSYAVPALDSEALKTGLGLSRYGVQYAHLVRLACLGAQVL